MATLHKLVSDAVLLPVDVPLDDGEFPMRWIYGTPEFISWLEDVLPSLETGRLKSDLSPSEQLDNIFYQWVSGGDIRYERMFKDLSPAEDEVWEFKTTDLRIFGWIYQPRIFIAVYGDYADLYKPPNVKASYESAKRTVLTTRNRIELDEPKFATGTFDALIYV